MEQLRHKQNKAYNSDDIQVIFEHLKQVDRNSFADEIFFT